VRAKIAVLASVILCANATAEPAKYAVDGLAVGMQLNFDDGSYREYRFLVTSSKDLPGARKHKEADGHPDPG
jgi:hypothetical protein